MATFFIKASGGTGSGANDATAWSLAHFNSQTKVPGNSYLFKCGDTFTGPITLGQSGTFGNLITLGSYIVGGVTTPPKFTGFTRLTGWTSLGGGKFEKTVPSPPTKSLNVVLVDDSFQHMGRFPKADLGYGSYYIIESFTTANEGTGPTAWLDKFGVLTSNGIGSIPSFVGGEMVQRSQQWCFDRSTVTAQTATTVSYTSFLSPDHALVSYEPLFHHGFFFQNHINCLTVNKEWCYNQATKKVTIFLSGGGTPTGFTIDVATQDTLLDLTGRSYILVDGLNFYGVNEQHILLSSSTNVTISNCTFQHAGINAIQIDRQAVPGTHHITVDGCHIFDVLNNGIDAVESANFIISNNEIDHCGMVQGMGISGDGNYCGIHRVGNDSLVEYNYVHHTGYSGIWYDGKNTIVRFNHVHDFCLKKADGGGIYSYGPMNGQTGRRYIHRNIVHHGQGDQYGINYDFEQNPYTGQVQGIYCDGDVKEVDVTDNTCFNCSASGIFLGSNGEINVTGNTCYNNKTAQLKGDDANRLYSNMVISNNIFFALGVGSLPMSMNVRTGSIAALTANNNQYCRPIWEPNGIDSGGYTGSPFSWLTYHDGGVIERGNKFKSLNIWKSQTGKDAASTKTAVAITNVNMVRFEYNETNANKIISLGGSYVDTAGAAFSGNVTLLPFTSKILIQSAAPPGGDGPVVLGRVAIVQT